MAWSDAQGGPLWNEAFWQPPFYPWALGGLYRLVGHDLLWPRWVQCFLGALSCLLVYAIGRRVFDSTTGAVAALVMAIYGPFIYYDGELSAGDAERVPGARRALPSCFAPWTTSARVHGWVRDCVSALPPSRARMSCCSWRWLSSGCFSSTAGRSRETAVRAAMLLLGAALPIAIVTVARTIGSRAISSSSRAMAGSTSTWETTLMPRRRWPSVPGFAWDALVNEPYLKAGIVKASERSRYFFQKGMTFIRENPRAALRLYGRKLALYWSSHEIGRNRDPYAASESSRVLRALLWRHGGFGFPFGIVAPLALGGLVGSRIRARAAAECSSVCSFCAYVVTGVLFFVAARYRLTVVPVLLLFAAAYGQRIVDFIRRRRSCRPRPARRRSSRSRSSIATIAAPARLSRGKRSVPRRPLHRPGSIGPGRGGLSAGDRRRLQLHRSSRRARAGPHAGWDAPRKRSSIARERRRCAPNRRRPLPGREGLPGAGRHRRRRELVPERHRRFAPYAPAYRDLGHHLHGDGRLGRGRLDAVARGAARSRGSGHLVQARAVPLPPGRYREAELALREALRLAPDDQEIREKIASLEALERALGQRAAPPPGR